MRHDDLERLTTDRTRRAEYRDTRHHVSIIPDHSPQSSHVFLPYPRASASTRATAGATKMRLSMRSRTPPCPGNNVPESFAPATRLIPDSKRSPPNPTGPTRTATRSAGPVFIPADTAISSATTPAAANPASVPSHVLPGLMVGV